MITKMSNFNVASVKQILLASLDIPNTSQQSILRERPGMINKILRLEQEGEHIHAVINRLERNLTMTLNKSTRYWQVLREYENKIYNGVK